MTTFIPSHMAGKQIDSFKVVLLEKKKNHNSFKSLMGLVVR